MKVNIKQDNPTKIIEPMKAQLNHLKFPFPAPRSRRQNHSSEILVILDDQENMIWKTILSFCTVDSHVSGTSQIWRFHPQFSEASDVTATMAIAKARPITMRTSSTPALHVIRNRVYRRSITTKNAREIQTTFTMRTPWPRVGGST